MRLPWHKRPLPKLPASSYGLLRPPHRRADKRDLDLNEEVIRRRLARILTSSISGAGNGGY